MDEEVDEEVGGKGGAHRMTPARGRSSQTRHWSLEVRRLLCRWQFGAALLLGWGALDFGMWQYTRTVHIGAAGASANGALFIALRLWLLVVPAVSVLATADLTAADRASGMLRYLLLRTSRTQYVIHKGAAAAVVGGGTVFLCIVLAGVVAMVHFPVLGVPLRSSFSARYDHFFPQFLYGAFPAFVALAGLYSACFGVCVGMATVGLGLLSRSAVVVTGIVWAAYMVTSLGIILSSTPALQRWAPATDVGVSTYAPSVQGPVWLTPLGWLGLAAIFWGLAWIRLYRRDVVD